MMKLILICLMMIMGFVSVIINSMTSIFVSTKCIYDIFDCS